MTAEEADVAVGVGVADVSWLELLTTRGRKSRLPADVCPSPPLVGGAESAAMVIARKSAIIKKIKATLRLLIADPL